MKNIALLFLILVLFALSSCIPSLHGIVTDPTRATDDRILGVWSKSSLSASEGMTDRIKRAGTQQKIAYAYYPLGWTFERVISVTYKTNDTNMVHTLMPTSHLPENVTIVEIDTLPLYTLIHREVIDGDTVTYDMVVNLTRINQHLLMDFEPNSESHKLFQGRFATNFIPGHTFAKVEFTGDNLRIFPLHSEYVEELIKQKRIRLKHEVIGDDSIVLTAPTQELRDFIDNYSDEPRLFDEPEVLNRSDK